MADTGQSTASTKDPAQKNKSSGRASSAKRRCVSTACIACRRRKSKCDGALPACAACSSVYGTECIYDPNSDHRRKGVYRDRADTLKTKSSTLQILIQAILNAAEEDVLPLVQQIRSCESLDDVADAIVKQKKGVEEEDEDLETQAGYGEEIPSFETEVAGKMGELRLENGSMRFLGGTSNLLRIPPASDTPEDASKISTRESSSDLLPESVVYTHEQALLSWTRATKNPNVIAHLINMYFTWHYPFFTTLSKGLFYRDFLKGQPSSPPKRTSYCSSILVNAMLALGCHFSTSPAAYSDPNDSSTKGDPFFEESKRLIQESQALEKPSLTTIQALALISVREAGCGREQKGWFYSGISFRMALDMGLNLDFGSAAIGGGEDYLSTRSGGIDERELDARRITFWGCFLFDKCWSNYLGRIPQLPATNITVPKYDVFPDEDAQLWIPYTDVGLIMTGSQPSRTRAVALQMSDLCEVSCDIMFFFYNPQHFSKPLSKATEIKKLGELQTRLEKWKRELPKEFEPRDGQMPQVLLLHMFFHLLHIHLFRPFLKYKPTYSPLPSHVSPRRHCIQAAASISKLMRLYKRIYGLRQICNIAVYMIHSACTIHLFNAGDKNSKRDIVHGVKHLEEIAEDWLCARRTLSILSGQASKWNIELPEEASEILSRTDSKFGSFSTSDIPTASPKAEPTASPVQKEPSPPPVLGLAPNFRFPLSQPSSTTVYPPPASEEQATSSAKESPYLDDPLVPNSDALMQEQQIPYTSSNVPFNSGAPLASIQPTHASPHISPYSRPHPLQEYTAADAQLQPHEISSSLQGPMTLTNPIRTNLVAMSEPYGGEGSAGMNGMLLEAGEHWWLKDQSPLYTDFDSWGNMHIGGESGDLDMAAGPSDQYDQQPVLYPTINPVNGQVNPSSQYQMGTNMGMGPEMNQNNIVPSTNGDISMLEELRRDLPENEWEYP